jgi:hypothetical protein
MMSSVLAASTPKYSAARQSSGEAGDEVTYVALANSWIIINVGGGPTDDKPTVTIEAPPNPERASRFLKGTRSRRRSVRSARVMEIILLDGGAA